MSSTQQMCSLIEKDVHTELRERINYLDSASEFTSNMHTEFTPTVMPARTHGMFQDIALACAT